MLNRSVNESIQISSLTWNLGNQMASVAAVSDAIEQLIPDPNNLPVVIAIATQEEMAKEGKRLHEQMLEALNKNLPEGEKYKIVLFEKHKTLAGANNMLKGGNIGQFAKAMLTDRNQVSNALLVKEPYDIQDADAKIYYEPGKEKGGNKSIIRIKGALTKNSQKIMDISIAGAHLDSNKDAKRREHINGYLSGEDLRDKNFDSIEDIFTQAQVFRVFMGDLNERDYLMRDGTTCDQTHQTNLSGFGFDVTRTPQQTLEGNPIHGTYGVRILDGQQIKGDPDPKQRAHVAREGHLDRVAFSSGLEASDMHYGATLRGAHCEYSEKKTYYHGADHFPVARGFSVKPATEETKLLTACHYIQNRIPNVDNDLKRLEALKRAVTEKDLDSFQTIIQSMQYYDDTLSTYQYIEQKFGIVLYEDVSAYFSSTMEENQLLLGLERGIEQLSGVQEAMMTYHQKLEAIKYLDKPSAKEQEEVVKIANIVSSYQASMNDIRLMESKLEDTEQRNKKIGVARRLFDLLDEHVIKTFKRGGNINNGCIVIKQFTQGVFDQGVDSSIKALFSKKAKTSCSLYKEHISKTKLITSEKNKNKRIESASSHEPPSKRLKLKN
ncbi:hypothetical protein CC99x_000435 [Candidatus Berkiella cookevillensis]|uniref:Endonuclease/Exonuclease/phosphatase family protein n=1 Tax=Candidatus Berkiella cookevillensis TaxID=437022 RepID=A0A0Q9YM44_9GAMM|nr:hypothetical protein [Candidatus Berkiella cookevillensis]MCS5707360.1 hypothetical protein [Candidatus Berkiella cookevillensis]